MLHKELTKKCLCKTEPIPTSVADMINQVLELGRNVGLLPSLVVKNQAGTQHNWTSMNNHNNVHTQHRTDMQQKYILSAMYQNLIHQTTTATCKHYLSFILCSSWNRPTYLCAYSTNNRTNQISISMCISYNKKNNFQFWLTEQLLNSYFR